VDENERQGAHRRDDPVVTATVAAQLPSGLYHVDVDGRHRITAHVGGGLARNFVRLVVGDRVTVELMPRDLTRGRIIKKL
jgi:translation initiation factor IF-1